MMTLIAGQPNAAATVGQCEALWSTRKFIRAEDLQSSCSRTVAETRKIANDATGDRRVRQTRGGVQAP
jgi:hypothetical protein